MIGDSDEDNEQSFREMWDTIKQTSIQMIKVLEDDREKGIEKH